MFQPHLVFFKALKGLLMQWPPASNLMSIHQTTHANSPLYNGCHTWILNFDTIRVWKKWHSKCRGKQTKHVLSKKYTSIYTLDNLILYTTKNRHPSGSSQCRKAEAQDSAGQQTRTNSSDFLIMTNNLWLEAQVWGFTLLSEKYWTTHIIRLITPRRMTRLFIWLPW